MASCQLIYGQSSFPSSYSLTPNITLGSLGDSYSRLTPMHGLTVQDLVCNLRQLAVNVIDPVMELLGRGNVHITSVLRTPETVTGSLNPPRGVSYHQQGLGIDMVFLTKSFSEYFEIAKQLKQNIEYDKLLLEYRIGTVNGVNTYKPWIHIQWQQPDIKMANGAAGAQARKQVFTLQNDRTHATGLVNLLPDSTLRY